MRQDFKLLRKAKKLTNNNKRKVALKTYKRYIKDIKDKAKNGQVKLYSSYVEHSAEDIAVRLFIKKHKGFDLQKTRYTDNSYTIVRDITIKWDNKI